MANKNARSTRIKILPLHHLQLLIDDTMSPAEILNLSTTGIAFKKIDGLEDEKTLKATMKISGLSLPVTLNVMRVTQDIMACSFQAATPDLAVALAKYFKTEIATAQMKEMPSDKLQKVEDGTPHFFLGSNENELFYVENKGKLVRFELSIFGNHVYCESDKKLRYGTVFSDDHGDKAKFKGSEMIGKATTSNQESKEIAVRFLESITALDSNIKKEMIALLIKTGT